MEYISKLKQHDGVVSIAHNGAISCCWENTSVSGIYGASGEALVAAAIAAGVLVVDYRSASWEDVYRVAVGGPMLAQGFRQPCPEPYGALSYVPRAYWLNLRRAIGCTIHNAREA